MGVGVSVVALGASVVSASVVGASVVTTVGASVVSVGAAVRKDTYLSESFN